MLLSAHTLVCPGTSSCVEGEQLISQAQGFVAVAIRLLDLSEQHNGAWFLGVTSLWRICSCWVLQYLPGILQLVQYLTVLEVMLKLEY